MPPPFRLLILSCAGAVLSSPAARAADEEDPKTRQMTQEEIEAWLDASAIDVQADVGSSEGVPEAPPPPPRRHGWVVEGAVGAAGHLGNMKHVSPTAPEFRLVVGYEILDPLLIFAESNLMLASTRYAKRPPNPRTYAYYGFGGGLRFTFEIAETFGLYLQGNAGVATASEDVLVIYGYTDSDALSLYFGGQLGFEWWQVNPHYALAVHGGVRDYLGFAREQSGDPPLVVNGGAAIKYTF